MKHLFGPVNSRRLGYSQGIDLLPPKICNFNCIYCEIGATTLLTCDRKEYIPTRNITREIETLLADREALERIDIFTITASGEPTLHTGIGRIIRFIKEKTAKPVAVLTNGSLLHLPEVRNDLMEADIVIPSLDSAREASYRKINRPAACAQLDRIIEGLKIFCKEFRGDMRLEILLARGINDAPEDIDALLKATRTIQPARIQLNTVARPPLEHFAEPLTRDAIERIAAQFETPTEILVDFAASIKGNFRPLIESELIEMLKRRPCTTDDISNALNLDPATLADSLSNLKLKGTIVTTKHYGKEYYQTQTEHICS